MLDDRAKAASARLALERLVRDLPERVLGEDELDRVVVEEALVLLDERVLRLEQDLDEILARELEVPVLAISQLSRAPEQRTPPKPMLSDLRESGSIEQDADLVAFLYREDYYRDRDEDPDGLAEVIIAKHRNGPIGTRKLVFLDRFPKFADFSGQEQPIEQPAGEGPPLADVASAGPEL